MGVDPVAANAGKAKMIDLRAYRPLLSRLACPDCRGGLVEQADAVICAGCKRRFTLSASGVLQLMPSHPKPEPPIYDDPDFKKYRALYDNDAEHVYYSNQNALFHWIHHSAHQRTHRYWTEWAQPGWVADIGCGTGDHFSYFADLSRVIGMDMSLGSLEAARRRFPAVLLIQADINALPLKNGVLSAVFSIYNLEHLYYLGEGLAEIDRVMARDGRFFVGLPTEGGFAWGLGRRLSTDRMYSKKYGIDYGRVMQIEHCNTARSVMRECRRVFALRRRRYFPMALLPSVQPNLTISAEFEKRGDTGPPSPMAAVFLDRDGVLNRTFVRGGVPHPPAKVSEVEILPGVAEAVALLRSKSFTLIVVTNQPDVARGTQTREVVEAINRSIMEKLGLDDVRVCFHDTADACACRKPKAGLLLDAAQSHGLDLGRSFIVGDRWSDVVAGAAAGCRTVLIDTPHNERSRCEPDHVVRDLLEAAHVIVSAT